VAGDGWGNAIAVRWSTLLELLMLFVCSVLECEIKAAAGFSHGGLALFFRDLAVSITVGFLLGRYDARQRKAIFVISLVGVLRCSLRDGHRRWRRSVLLPVLL